MADMTKTEQLTIPNPKDWCTVAYAAVLLGLSARQVRRYVGAGTLLAYVPRVGPHEERRKHLLLAVAQVEELRAARLKTAAHNCAYPATCLRGGRHVVLGTEVLP
jgi:hypothetical protein